MKKEYCIRGEVVMYVAADDKEEAYELFYERLDRIKDEAEFEINEIERTYCEQDRTF